VEPECSVEAEVGTEDVGVLVSIWSAETAPDAAWLGTELSIDNRGLEGRPRAGAAERGVGVGAGAGAGAS
jgi:hypothetical protein